VGEREGVRIGVYLQLPEDYIADLVSALEAYINESDPITRHYLWVRFIRTAKVAKRRCVVVVPNQPSNR